MKHRAIEAVAFGGPVGKPMPNRMVSAIEAIAFVRSVLTKAMSRIAPPQWGQTISLPKVRLSNSTLSTVPRNIFPTVVSTARPTFDFVSIASCLSATSGVVSNPEFTGSAFGLGTIHWRHLLCEDKTPEYTVTADETSGGVEEESVQPYGTVTPPMLHRREPSPILRVPSDQAGETPGF